MNRFARTLSKIRARKSKRRDAFAAARMRNGTLILTGALIFAGAPILSGALHLPGSFHFSGAPVFARAIQTGVQERRVTRYDGKGIVQLAQKYLGTPYRYGGNSPAGFDCSGFTSYVYKKAGYRLPRATTAQYGKMNPVRAPQVGDLVFFRTSGKRISHVGIYVGNYQFIHAPSSGKTVSYADIRNSYWKPRYAGSRTIFRRAR